MLSFLHSRRMAHDLMILAVLAMEIFFAWRASLMYVFILTGRVNTYELEAVRWLVFLAVGVFGFALATHRHAGIEAIRAHQKTNWTSLWGLFLAVGIVVLHDIAATIYTVGTIDSFGAIAAVVGMCGLVFLPFLVGYMSHAVAQGIEKENKARDQNKIDGWRRKAELRYWKQHYKTMTFIPEAGIDLLPSMDDLIAGAARDDAQDEEEALPESASLSTSGKQRTMFNASEIHERWLALGISYTERTISSWMEPRCASPYALQKSRKFRLSKPTRSKEFERRAPLASIIEIEQKILADRASKVTQLPTQELAQIEA